MTPEGLQSTEELSSSEKVNTDPVSSNSVPFRVKNVCEINTNEAEAAPLPPIKRKLPSWMLSSPDDNPSTSDKKIRSDDNTKSLNTDNQPESSFSFSTSTNRQETSDSEPSTSEGIGNNLATNVNPDSESKEIETNTVIASTSSSVKVEPIDGGDGNTLKINDNEVDASRNVSNEVQPDGVIVTASTSNNLCSTPSDAKVKSEPIDEDNEAVGLVTPASPRDIKPAIKVEKEEATSSTVRPSCKFGIRCYRRNAMHRIEEAHPGDQDYTRPDFPAPPDGTPSCPYGDLCYRRNPVHFQQYSHPPSTDFQKNYNNYKMRLRERKQQRNNTSSDLDDYDLDDPFINDDSEDEYIPSQEYEVDD